MEIGSDYRIDHALAEKAVGLSEELTAYFAGQLEKERLKQDSGGRQVVLFGEDGNRIEDDAADLLPPHLAVVINEVLRLDRLHNGGAVFGFPDGLSPVEWTAMDALQSARIEDQAKADSDRKQKVNESAEKSRLDAMRRRGR